MEGSYYFTEAILENEEWRTLPTNKYYQVSNYGRVRSLDKVVYQDDGRIRHCKGQMLKPNIGTNGYLYFGISDHSKRTTVYIHNAVALLFIGESNGLDVDHINCVKTDNRAENLRYITHFENASRANKGRGRDCSMEKNSRSKEVIGYKEGQEVERYSCAKYLTQKYGINYSTLRHYLQRGGIMFNDIYYCYETEID